MILQHVTPAVSSVRERLFDRAPCISFEIFPPRTSEGAAQLARTLDDLQLFEPGYVSVTCGAGGSSHEGTLETARLVQARGVRVLAHLTCSGHDGAELHDLLRRLRDEGVEDLLALRGDPPAGETHYEPRPGELAHASDLVRFIRASGAPFCIGAACYPEGHLESESKAADLDHLRAKVAAGAEFLVTQVFFENAFYFDFVERCRRAGIFVPIVPGIMPVTSYEQIERFTRKCGATVPRRLQLQLERYQHAPEAARQAGVEHTSEQCAELLERGAPGIHFFTLNRSDLAKRVLASQRLAARVSFR